MQPNIKFKKALSELSTNPKRTALVIFALFLGIWGIGSVLVSYVILTKDMDSNFQSTIPANVVYYSDDFGKLNVEEFSKKAEIEEAELRDFSVHRIEVKPDEWIPLWLFGVDDFSNMKLARIYNEEAKSTPDSGTILVERDSKRISNLKTGATPRIRIGEKNMQVTVSGICFDPAQAPATQDAFVYAYTDKKTYSQLTGLETNKRLIVRFKNAFSEQDVKNASQKLIHYFTDNKIAINKTDIPRFNEHPHQWQLNTLLFIIGTIGFLAFAMGAVLVSQLINSIMTNQIKQIGILKSIGATRTEVFKIYIFMILIIGVIASILAIPAAIKTGYLFSYFVATKLNFDILTTSLPIKVYVYLILSGILFPVVFSFSALLKGTRVSVKSTLSDYGISRKVKSSEFSFLKKLSVPDSLKLAVKNSQRNVKRLAITVLTLAFGVAIFGTGFNVRQSLWELLAGVKSELRYDVQVVLNKPIEREKLTTIFAGVPNVKYTEMWVGGRGELQSKIVATDMGAGIIALPYNTDRVKLKMISGKWLQKSSDIEIFLNQQSWALYKNPAIGSFLHFTVGTKNISARVVGIAEQFEKPKIYMDINQYDSICNPEHLANNMIFVAKNNTYSDVIELKKSIERKIVPSDLNVLYVMSQVERVKIIYDHLNIILSTIILLSLLVLIVSAVGMASVTGINIWERTREIGVMRAIGATPKQIYSLFVTEGFITSFAGIVFGLIISYPLSRLASVFFGKLMLGKSSKLEYAFSISGFFITIGVTLIFSWLASRIPAKSAIKVSTSKALSYE